MTFKVLTDDTRKVIYRSNIRSAADSKSRNLRLDPITNTVSSPIIRSRHDSSDHGEGTMPPDMQIINPHDLVGRTFLLPQEEDGQRFRAHIVKALNDYDSNLGTQPERIRFLCTAKDGKYEEILLYSQLMDSLEPQEDGEGNDSKFLDATGTQQYQSLIGALQWSVSIGRFDITTAVMTMSSFRAMPRLGHMTRVKRLYGYLAKMKDGVIRIRTGEPDYSGLPDQAFDWERSVYGDVSELLPSDAPKPLGKYVTLTHYYDANLFHDIVTGRSVTGILHLINKTPLDWYSKKQATVETATYGSEFVAARTCVDQIVDLRTTLRYLGVPIRDKSYVFGDNKTVVDSSTIPHAKLHKRHNALSFHRVREAIASKFIEMHHLDGIFNPADILSKHWAYPQVWHNLKPLLFFQGDTAQLYDEG